LIKLPEGLQKVQFHGLQTVEENGHFLPGQITFLMCMNMVGGSGCTSSGKR
jgi:hypothetical protein